MKELRAILMLWFTLITKNFGRFKFRTNGCPKLKTSEIFRVRNIWRPKFFDGICFLIFNVAHCRGLKKVGNT